MLEELTITMVFHAILLFARIGTMLMLLPGFGESNTSMQGRLWFAAGLSLVFLPLLQPTLPQVPTSTISLVLLVSSEIIVGVFIGSMTRIVFSVLHTAGMIISFQMGLSAAMLFDPSQGSQGSVVGNFLTIVAFVLLFTTNMHHVFIYGMIDSYVVFVPADPLPWGEFAEFAGRLTSDVFNMAFRMASPLVICGLLVYLAAGVMSRLMPQMQVFFVLVPLQVLLGFFILIVTMSGSMMWFMDYLAEVYASMLIPN